MLALPADPRRLRQRLLHHRRGVDEDLDLRPGLRHQPAPEPLQPLLDQVVIVAPPRIDADRPAVAPRQHRQRVLLRRIDLRQHDHRPRLRPERRRRPAPAHPLRHPAHLPVPARRHEGREPPRRLGDRIRRADAAGGEPLLQRARLQPPGQPPLPGASSEVEVRIMLRRGEPRHQVGQDRAERRPRLDLGVPLVHPRVPRPVDVARRSRGRTDAPPPRSRRSSACRRPASAGGPSASRYNRGDT